MSKKPTSQTAFSMLEASMVMLIIGFLVIGISVGKNIVSSAKLTRAKVLTNSSVVSSIKDLVYWIDSTSTASFNVSDPITGTAISTWNDINPQKISKNNVTQAISANQPSYVSNSINGLPAIRFDGVNDYLYLSAPNNLPSGNSNRTLFFVVNKYTTTTADGWNFILHYGTSNYLQTFDVTLGGTGGVGLHLFYWDFLVSATTGNAPKIISIVYKESNGGTLAQDMTFYHNGVSYPATGGRNVNVDATLNSTSTNLTIGAREVSGTFFSFTSVDLGEVIIYDQALTNSERRQVELYLSKKWNIPLT